MYIGWPVLRISRTAVRSGGGQLSGAPSGVERQSCSRMSIHFAAAGEEVLFPGLVWFGTTRHRAGTTTPFSERELRDRLA